MNAGTWLALVVTAAVSLSGCWGQSDAAKKKAQRELTQARAQIQQERSQAQSQVADAQAKVSDADDTLAQKKAQIKRAERRLERLRSEANGVQSTIDANTIPGTGTFEVGKDIQPGTYRAEAHEGCYWARLSSLNTDDIIDNNNTDGPVVIEVQPTDRALETDGCAEFHRSG